MKQTRKKARISIRITRRPAAARKKPRKDSLKRLCWGLLPIATVALLVLDANGIYTFNTERLLVLGIGLLILLLPCFSQITLKDLTFRRDKPDE